MILKKSIYIDDIKIHYKECTGKSIPVVLLHGYSFSSQTWLDIGTLSLFEKNDIHAIAVDMPGFGLSEGKRLRASEKVSDFMKKLFDALKLNKIILVGPSMGGGYALIYALRFPKMVKGLVLVAPASLDKSHIKDNLTTLKMPVLIFWGTKDNVFPIKKGYELHSMMPNSKLIICKNARHPCYLDTPDIFHKNLISFIKEISSN